MKRCKNMLTGLFIGVLALMLLCSCQTQRQTIVETKTETRYVDSIIYKDSITYIPFESHVKMTWYGDTLSLSTSLAEATAWLDTTMNVLSGEIHNKQAVQHKYITQTEYMTRDSIAYVEKPVPYEVEVVKTKNAAWWVWVWAIIASIIASCGLVFFAAKRLT